MNRLRESFETMTPIEVVTRLADAKVVPLVVIDDASDAAPLADALVSGGITAIEIALRSQAAVEAIRRISQRDDIVIGAGTVLTVQQLGAVVEAGARFVVSPGFDPAVAEIASKLGVLPLPGIATPTELQACLRLGLTAVKLFPIKQLGGPDFAETLAGPFPEVGFMPSGGITPKTAIRYLQLPSIFAVSGSWVADRVDICAKRFDLIRDNARRTTTALGIV